MENIINALERLAENLAAKVPPGHCDYISKSDAAARLRYLVKELRAEPTGPGAGAT